MKKIKPSISSPTSSVAHCRTCLLASVTSRQAGKRGAMILVILMGLAILATIFGMLPLVGSFVVSSFALVAAVLVFMG